MDHGQCNNIFHLDKGKILDTGTYNSLLKRNLTFKEMNESYIKKVT